MAKTVRDSIKQAMGHEDEVSLTIPLLIRLMEFAREDAKNDMVLHEVAERAAKSKGCLGMADYDHLIGE